jgi:hypothetical protein
MSKARFIGDLTLREERLLTKTIPTLEHILVLQQAAQNPAFMDGGIREFLKINLTEHEFQLWLYSTGQEQVRPEVSLSERLSDKIQRALLDLDRQLIHLFK